MDAAEYARQLAEIMGNVKPVRVLTVKPDWPPMYTLKDTCEGIEPIFGISPLRMVYSAWKINELFTAQQKLLKPQPPDYDGVEPDIIIE